MDCTFVKDKFHDLDTYAGTTSRPGQRIANVVATEHLGLILFSFDVSQAFAQGMTFEEFSAFIGAELGEVQFDAPKADLECVKPIEGRGDFNPATEALTMLKPKHGLTDDPRAWKPFRQVLVQWMPCRQLHSEPELHCVHQCNTIEKEDAIARAKEHDKEQQEYG